MSRSISITTSGSIFNYFTLESIVVKNIVSTTLTVDEGESFSDDYLYIDHIDFTLRGSHTAEELENGVTVYLNDTLNSAVEFSTIGGGVGETGLRVRFKTLIGLKTGVNTVRLEYEKPSKLTAPRLGTQTTGVGYVNRVIYNDNSTTVTLYNYTTSMGTIKAGSSSSFKFNGTSGITNTAKIHFEASGYENSDEVSFTFVPSSPTPSTYSLTCYYYWGNTIHETEKFDIEAGTSVNPNSSTYKKDYTSEGYTFQRQSLSNSFIMNSNTSISYYYESEEELNAKKIILTSAYPLQNFTMTGTPASGSGPAVLTSSPGLSSSVSGEQKITFGDLEQSVRVNSFSFVSQTNFETSSINLQILVNGEQRSFVSISSTGSDRNWTTTIVLASTFTIAPRSTTTIQITSGEARTFSLNVDYEGINQVTEQTIGNGYHTLTGASGTIPNSYTPTSANYCYFTCRNDVDPNSFTLTINGNSVTYTCDKRSGTGIQGYTYYFEFTNTFFTTYLNINITKKSVAETTLIASFEVQNLNDIDCTLNYTLSVENTYNKTGEITIPSQSSQIITDEIVCGGELPTDNINCSLVGYFTAPLKERSDNSTTSYVLNVSQSVVKLNNVKVKRKK